MFQFDDNNFTTEDVLKAVVALNEKYGVIPGTVAYEYGDYDLYYDSEYKGGLNSKNITAYNTSAEWQPTTESKETAEAVIADKAVATLKGDADLNGEVSLTDIVAVSKNPLSDEAYPLANDTAYANADMNNDTKVNAVDTSALIENQLGKK